MLKKSTLLLLAAVMLMAWFALSSGAFDGNDYDGGSWDNDSSWDSGDSGWSGSGGDNGDIPPTAILVIIVIGGWYIWSKFIRPKKNEDNKAGKSGSIRDSSREGKGIQLPDRTAQIETLIKAHDPNFTASSLVSFVKRVYIDIQTAWCKRDMAPVRAYLHDNLYDATVKQVRAKIDQGVIYHYESMVVNTAYLTSYAKDAQYEYITLYLNARMIDWQEDEKTGKILRGDKTTRWDLRYKMKFMRSMGVLTKEATSGATEHSCPNCGASLEMTSSAKCKYCGALVTTGQYSWVLSDFGTIRNDTLDEGVTEE